MDERSSLLIVDPPSKPDFTISENNAIFAEDAIVRAVAAKGLRLAGYSALSAAMSSPSGPEPSTLRGKGRAEEFRAAYVQAKSAQAAEELARKNIRGKYQRRRETYRGRSVAIDLPMPLQVEGRLYTRIKIKSGINDRFLQELVGKPLVEEPLQESGADWREMLGKAIVRSAKNGADFSIGDLYQSELRLEV